jgi:hypothetical protein
LIFYNFKIFQIKQVAKISIKIKRKIFGEETVHFCLIQSEGSTNLIPAHGSQPFPVPTRTPTTSTPAAPLRRRRAYFRNWFRGAPRALVAVEGG